VAVGGQVRGGLRLSEKRELAEDARNVKSPTMNLSQPDDAVEASREQAERLNRLVLGAAIGLIFFGVVGYFAWRQTPYGNTRYAPGYSEAAFRSIRVGDTEASVVAKLGQPLAIYDGKLNWVWDYTRAIDRRDRYRIYRFVNMSKGPEGVWGLGDGVGWDYGD
jgi:hypothetical protein